MLMSIVHATDGRTIVHRASRLALAATRPRASTPGRARTFDRIDARHGRTPHGIRARAPHADWHARCCAVRQVRRQAAMRSAAAPLRGNETQPVRAALPESSVLMKGKYQ